MKNICDFKDIHTHNLKAGPDAIINLPWRSSLPPEGYFSAGIHPWDTSKVSSEDLAWVESLSKDPRVVAIGEAGLDALRGASLPEQEAIFRRHVELSERAGKPLIIHAVRTLHHIIRLRKELRPSQRWIIHGFRGKPDLARQLLDAGIDISLGMRFNPDTENIIPADRLFRESDEDY